MRGSGLKNQKQKREHRNVDIRFQYVWTMDIPIRRSLQSIFLLVGCCEFDGFLNQPWPD